MKKKGAMLLILGNIVSDLLRLSFEPYVRRDEAFSIEVCKVCLTFMPAYDEEEAGCYFTTFSRMVGQHELDVWIKLRGKKLLSVEAALRTPEYFDYEFEAMVSERWQWVQFRDGQLTRCIADAEGTIAAFEAAIAEEFIPEVSTA